MRLTEFMSVADDQVCRIQVDDWQSASRARLPPAMTPPTVPAVLSLLVRQSIGF